MKSLNDYEYRPSGSSKVWAAVGGAEPRVAVTGPMMFGGTTVKPVEVTLTAHPGYETLVKVLRRAHDQAAFGKGAERHANGKPFHLQPMQDIIRLCGAGFAIGQAAKKSSEALGMAEVERQVAEILGAINYLAGAVIALEGGSK